MFKWTLPIALLMTFFSTGCARHDFQIIKPDRLSQRITEVRTRVNTDHMAYDMVAKENRLVVLVLNQTDATVQLLGDRSFVVDPNGASHPLRSQAIATKSYAKLILPPLRPRFEQSPQFHFGAGTSISQTPDSATPRYMDMYEDSDNRYWDWDGEAPIRLSITFQGADGKQFTDEFTIEKTRPK